ncbi:glycerate kinase [Variovorax saccharolyticus]|uniref:glycerate kinase n=1 Tax=Variovorax saccharolyticus TaxID=3053516 RepID=UPI002576B9F3|nr:MULTISPECIES: glycerate kinase [unclassified Variovorax]MDM0017186.1 glycerate kinase [Variovorax sp. J22R187]MDM0030240.1 glycerate kinase [Variovorax sp. J31P216]
MNLSKLFVPVGGLILLGVAYRSYGWAGVALVGGAIVMFLLMHFNRTMQVLKRAADRPIGTVASAVMLNAKLKRKATLLHVIAMTRALGELRSPKDEQPELFRWTDAGGSWVDVTFVGGKVTEWTLVRPEAIEDETAAGAPSADAVKPGAADALRPPV